MDGGEDFSGSEKLRSCNPKFAKLVDVVCGAYLEDGMPAYTQSKLKQVE